MGVNFKNGFGAFIISVNIWDCHYFSSCGVTEESTTGLNARALWSPSLLHTNVLSIAGDPSTASPSTASPSVGCSSAANWPALLAGAMANPPQGTRTFLIQWHQSPVLQITSTPPLLYDMMIARGWLIAGHTHCWHDHVILKQLWCSSFPPQKSIWFFTTDFSDSNI